MKSRSWLQILVIGTILFFASEWALTITGNPNFFPTILMLGSFLIPVVFVVYFYDHVKHREISLPLLTTSFVVGGVVGAVAGGILEYNTVHSMSISSLFGVGLIEESAKMIFPFIVYLGWRYKHEADGLLFGIAAGMGFAAIETMGYGLVYLIQSGGDINGLQQLLVIRGFLSPAEHAAWTGFLCAVLWHEREKTGKVNINMPVIFAFVLAISLHAVWDIFNTVNYVSMSQFILLFAGNTAIALVSMALLIYRYRDAKKELKVAV